MDHAINALKPFLEAELDCVLDEYKSGKYVKLSNCPSYLAAKALIKAIHELEKYYYGKARTCTIKTLLGV